MKFSKRVLWKLKNKNKTLKPNIYKNRGHCVKDIKFNNLEDTIHMVLADNEFKILQEEVEEMGVNVSIVTK